MLLNDLLKEDSSCVIAILELISLLKVKIMFLLISLIPIKEGVRLLDEFLLPIQVSLISEHEGLSRSLHVIDRTFIVSTEALAALCDLFV